jgi:hypothetical protein
MKANRLLPPIIFPLAFVATMASFAPQLQANETAVQVQEIEVNRPSSTEQADSLWDQTKYKTGEATDAAAEYTKVQSTRALEATKQGLSDGAEVVSTQSKKAWDGTKQATSDAVDYSAEKATQAGHAISDAFTSDTRAAPVVDKSINQSQSN